jgi:hypothetical protein
MVNGILPIIRIKVGYNLSVAPPLVDIIAREKQPFVYPYGVWTNG